MKRHVDIFDHENGGIYVEVDNNKGKPIIYLCASHDACIQAGGAWYPLSRIQSKMPKDTWSQIVGLPIKDSSKHYNVSCAS